MLTVADLCLFEKLCTAPYFRYIEIGRVIFVQFCACPPVPHRNYTKICQNLIYPFSSNNVLTCISQQIG